MNLDPKALRAAWKATLHGIRTGVEIHAYDVGQATGNYIMLKEGSPFIDYHKSMGDQIEVKWIIEVRTNAADRVSASIAMDDLLSAGTGRTASIRDRIEGDADDTSPLAVYFGVHSNQRPYVLRTAQTPFWDGDERVCRIDFDTYGTRS